MQRLDSREFDPRDPDWSDDLLRRKDRKRIAAAFVGAILLHASFALGFVNLQSEPVAPPGEMVITVDLAPAMVSEAAGSSPAEAAESVPQEQTPPEPERPPEEVVEEVKPEPLPEEPVEPEPEVVEEQKVEPPPPAEKAEVVVPTKPRPKPKPTPKPKPKPQTSQAASTTSAQRADIGGSGARATPNEINKYAGRVRAAIERKKSRPSSANGASGIAHVAFTITRSGGVTALRLTRSSGDAALDGAARAAVMAANIPPIPDSLPAAINIGVPIRFK